MNPTLKARFSQNSGAILVLMAATLWGTTGTSQALAPAAAQPAVVGALRLIIGGMGLVGVAYARGHLVIDRHWLRPTTLIGGLSAATYQLCFFAAVSRTGVAVGTVIGVGSSPLLAGFLAYLLYDEALSRRWWLATGLAIAGGTLLMAPRQPISLDVLGIGLALGAGLSYAVYTLSTKQLLYIAPADKVTAMLFSWGSLLLLPVLLTHDLSWLWQPSSLVVIGHLGLVATTLSYVLFARGLRHIAASSAVTLSLAEPLTASALGILLLGEDLTALNMAGMGLVFAGLYLTLGDRRVG